MYYKFYSLKKSTRRDDLLRIARIAILIAVVIGSVSRQWRWRWVALIGMATVTRHTSRLLLVIKVLLWCIGLRESRPAC